MWTARTAHQFPLASMFLSAMFAAGTIARADIYRWDNGQVIPGTEGITPGPGVQLNDRQLEYAGLGSVDLTGASFERSNLTHAYFYHSTLTGANLTGADLTNASLYFSTLTGADLTGASVTGAIMAWTSRGFTKEQLYSTASYQQKNLRGIDLALNDLGGWDLSGQNLANAGLYYSTLTNADLAGANLTNANLRSSTLTGADLTGAIITGANITGTTSLGFTKEQLYSTASYQQKNLRGTWLGSTAEDLFEIPGNDLSGWDLSGQDLTHAKLGISTLTGADLTAANLTNADLGLSTLTGASLIGAIVAGADFSYTALTKEQLYSTPSYQQRNLRGIGLRSNDLTGWDLSGQDITNANLDGSTLTASNLAGTTVLGVDFYATTSRGFTKEQLYSTASYQQKDLRGIGLARNDLSGWDLNGQDLSNSELWESTLTNVNLVGANLTNASLAGSTFSGANLTAADVRGPSNVELDGAIVRNVIRPDGTVLGLGLAGGHELVVRDYDGYIYPVFSVPPLPPIPIAVYDHFAMSVGGVLRLVFESDPWDSLISFEPGIPVQLGGTLELMFAADVNLASQVGRTFALFNWTGVAPTGAFSIASPYVWDLSDLYTTGEVTLLTIPEPSAAALLIIGALLTTLRRVRNGGNANLCQVKSASIGWPLPSSVA